MRSISFITASPINNPEKPEDRARSASSIDEIPDSNTFLVFQSARELIFIGTVRSILNVARSLLLNPVISGLTFFALFRSSSS
ncbi:hypothetical protein ES703_116691 [subsurface metagenome]